MSALSSVLDRLQGIVGPDHLLTDTAALGEYTVEGRTPAAVALPGTVEEVAALLGAAAEMKVSVLLRGAGHHLYLGAPPAPIGLVVSLVRLRQIVEYDAGDLTITAQAGIPLAALRQAVAEHGQTLPLDPPGPETATLGGTVAANLSGPMRMRHGTARDLALGMRVALTTGEVIKTGGRTVKNVAGYDLTKLLVGSLGTIGAIVEITLRLAPAPEQRAVVLAAVPREKALEAASRITCSPWEIAACELISPNGLPTLRPYLPAPERRDTWGICMGLAGSAEIVQRQEREIGALVGDGRMRFEGGDVDQIWERVRTMAYPAQAGGVLVRAGVRPGEVGEVLTLISSRPGWTAVAHAGDGLIYASPDTGAEPTAAREMVAEIRRLCQQAGGYAMLESGPVDLKRELGVWGEGIANRDLMKALKSAYDPVGTLGCGRVV